MFTGIIEGQGRIIGVQKDGLESRFSILPLFKIDQWENGESVAVNGACLSVENFTGEIFSVYASRETLSVTNLKNLLPNAHVNLERAVKAGQRLGGHLVSGHVDCVAIVKTIRSAGQSKTIVVNFPSKFAALVIPKGSVALNGISLTINQCGKDFLEVNIIPDTAKRTNIASWRPGAQINMETDLIGKYVGRYLENEKASCSITNEFLIGNGFI